jgi:hypothetical protein
MTFLDCVQEAQDAAKTAAQQAGWLQDDGSIALVDVHTVISARNCAKPQREKLRLPDFMAEKLQQYREMMNASSEDGSTADNAGGSSVT